MPIFSRAKRCILMTGTPILSHPVELFNLMKIIRPDVIPSFTAFTYRYCDPKATKFAIDYSGSACLEELNYVLKATTMIRRLKKDVLTELPAKTR